MTEQRYNDILQRLVQEMTLKLGNMTSIEAYYAGKTIDSVFEILQRELVKEVEWENESDS